MEQLTPEMTGAGQMMIMTDPPLHVAMRRAFNRLFLPRAVGRYDSPGTALVDEILNEAVERGECDFVVDVAARLPMAFICEIMGMPGLAADVQVGQHVIGQRGSGISD
jgi:cytochrome P450